MRTWRSGCLRCSISIAQTRTAKGRRFRSDLNGSIGQSLGIYDASKHRLSPRSSVSGIGSRSGSVIDARVTNAEQYSARAAKGEIRSMSWL